MEISTEKLPATREGLARAAAILSDGGLVAFPTETVYGLGADARNDDAVARIFEAKQRPQFNPLIVHMPDIASVEAIATIPASARPLLALWPGPLTLVLPKRHDSGLSDLVTAGLDTVAVRVPKHRLGHALLTTFNGPVAAPSANPSGKISPTSAEHVFDALSDRINAVLDGGPCEVGLESTIIGFEGDTPILLRSGGMEADEIEVILGHPLKVFQGSDITAPGQLKSHYAPNAAMRINATSPNSDEVWLGFGPDETTQPTLNLSETGNLREAATNLFAHMRTLDTLATTHGLQKIAVAKIPHTGLGIAINDRLERAAAPRG